MIIGALLCGCGLAGTAGGTAAGAAAEAEQARQVEAQAQQRLDDARQADDARRNQAEKDAQ